MDTVNLRRRFPGGGVDRARYEKPRPGQKPKITARIEAKLCSMVCSDPPEGHSRWTLRLLADRLVALELVDSISHTAVRDTLIKMSLNPGCKSSGVLVGSTASISCAWKTCSISIELPYDPLCPVVCYDELPFQLLGDVLVPIPMKPGKIYRYDHHYKF